MSDVPSGRKSGLFPVTWRGEDPLALSRESEVSFEESNKHINQRARMLASVRRRMDFYGGITVMNGG